MKRWLTASIVVVALVGVGGLALTGLGWAYFQPMVPGSTETVSVEITRGTAESQVAKQLTAAGLIRHPLTLRLATRILGVSGQLQAGVYELGKNESVWQIARHLTQNTRDIRVTLPEGLRAEEVVASLEKQLNTTATDPDLCITQNGHLYPETYSFVPGTTVEEACQRLRRQFDTVWTELTEQLTPTTNWDQNDVVTLASLVQREAKDPEDMRHVAGVLYNRLQIGMPLQIDATLQYAKGYDERNQTWWPTPLAADKNINSPYNTYQNTGLPPAPISNPGHDALTAVLNPLETDDLYYISTLDGGKMYFTPDYSEHLQNIERYLR